MKLSATWKVLVIICMVFTFVACDMNIDKVSPPDWIQGTWEGATNTFTFTKNDIVHVITGDPTGFTATSSDIAIVNATYSIDIYQVELTKGGVTTKYKFEYYGTKDPKTLDYYYNDVFTEELTKLD